MTNEQAARILDPETSRETLDDIAYHAGFHGYEAVDEAVGEACRIAARVLRGVDSMMKETISHESVYTFSVRLCDNEIDRVFDRFAPETLEQLSGLFVGKCGIFDHDWSARGQSARIFRTQVIRDESRTTRTGDPYCYLKGWAYMIRTEENAPLIAEIEGGIKKEVSVGCAVARAVCSICGADAREGCGHQKGTVYDGALCFHSLEEATDAYEWHFL